MLWFGCRLIVRRSFWVFHGQNHIFGLKDQVLEWFYTLDSEKIFPLQKCTCSNQNRKILDCSEAFPQRYSQFKIIILGFIFKFSSFFLNPEVDDFLWVIMNFYWSWLVVFCISRNSFFSLIIWIILRTNLIWYLLNWINQGLL